MLQELPSELKEFIISGGLWDEIENLIETEADAKITNLQILDLIETKLNEPKTATGSLRAPEGYHLPLAMKELSESYLKFGGHPGAAGFTALESNLPAIKQNLSVALENQKLNLNLEPTSFLPKDYRLPIPELIQPWTYQKNLIWIKVEQLTTELLNQILSLDPFGQDFPFPGLVFVLDSQYVQNYGQLKVIGKDKNHIKLTLPQSLNLTAFFVDTDTIESIQNYDQIYQLWIIAKPSQNTWNNNTKLELIANKLELIHEKL